MRKTHALLFAMAMVVAIVLYSMIVAGTIGRFTRTHAIISKSICTDCHYTELMDLDKGRHIGPMGKDQSYVIDNWFFLKNEAEVQGLCLTCHNNKPELFGFADLYIDNSGNYSAIKDLVIWDNIYLNQTGTETESIKVNITLENLSPDYASFSIDATVQLMNFSGLQNRTKLSTNTLQTLSEGESAIIERTNIYPDYFKIYITVYGIWNSSKLNVTIEKPSRYSSLTLYAKNDSDYFSLPQDTPLQTSYLLFYHTDGWYNVTNMKVALGLMNSSDVISLDNLLNDTVNNRTRYSCSATDTMCHINQQITDLGQRFEGKKFYAHELPYSTIVCSKCHLP